MFLWIFASAADAAADNANVIEMLVANTLANCKSFTNFETCVAVYGET